VVFMAVLAMDGTVQKGALHERSSCVRRATPG
jgi:hypothetical protein